MFRIWTLSSKESFEPGTAKCPAPYLGVESDGKKPSVAVSLCAVV